MRPIRIACCASMRALVVGLLLVACSGAGSAWAVSINEYSIPTGGALPEGIASGPDGKLWFVEEGGNKIGRVTPAGAMTEFGIPTPGSGPHGITTGADGNLWFTESNYGTIGRITPSGAITEFPIPAAWNYPIPFGITSGPDGNLWFAASGLYGGADYIGRVTTGGVMTGFALPYPGSGPYGITAGPDGNLWFTESSSYGNSIGRITPSGAITEFPLPTPSSGPYGITAGPDGNIWFAENGADQIGRITPAGTITEFPLPTPSNGRPAGITTGGDGNVWFTENNGFIGWITPGGVVTEFLIPTPSSYPFRITSGPDGNLWFTESGTSKIGQVILGGARVAVSTRLYPLTPCRVLDTRVGSGALGGPALLPNMRRDFDVVGVCGIPAAAVAISANVTVTDIGAQGELILFPSDVSRPNTSAISFRAFQTRANNALVYLSATTTTFSVFNNSAASLDFILDVNGYFQ